MTNMVIATMKNSAVKISVSNSSESEDEISEYEADDSDKDQNSLKQSGNQSESGSEASDQSEGLMITNEGWADSVAKILGSSKPKNKRTLVLSRAKKHSEIVKKEEVAKPSFEVVGESKEEPIEVKSEETVLVEPPTKKKRHEKSSIRIKPNILDKDRERLLAKIATKGVVQLFNAVRNQQKTLDKELHKDLTEAKKEKILKKFDKRTFLDTLMGQTKSIVVDEQTEKLKDELKSEEEKPKWNALRDDFMMGAKMKDWDKEPADE